MSVGLGGSEGVRMYRDHLGTAFGDSDVREDLSAVAGGGLTELAVLVKAEVYRVRGEPRFEGRFADTLEPMFEKTKRELGAKAKSDEDVLSYIAFPQLAEHFFARRENPVPAEPGTFVPPDAAAHVAHR